MAFFHNSAIIGASGQAGYQVERSLRFNSADSAYLNRTAGTPTDNKKWTWSAWAKISGASQALNFASSGSGTSMYFGLETSQGDNFIMQIAGSRVYKSTAIFRDPSAWYHFVFVFDSANGTQADRSILYVNGVRQAATTASVTLNQTTGFNAASTAMHIGYSNAWSATSSDYFSGYLTEIHFIDGQALTPSSFGETDTITGVWKPKRYAGTYGTNGFFLKFADNSGTTAATLGKDSSGNGNNWTPNNFSVTAGAGNDSMIDSCTPYADGGNGRGNYCTLNPLDKNSTQVPKDGNLYFDGSVATGGLDVIAGTMRVVSGKWYWESTITAVGSIAVAAVGITKIQSVGRSDGGSLGSVSGECAYLPSGSKRVDGSITAYGSSYTTNDVIGVALDCDAGTVTFYKNNTSQGSISYAVDNGLSPVIGQVQGYGAIQTLNFGQRAFAYTPPSGFLALNTQNLPEPSIKKPSSYMDAVLWTGNGVNGRVITTNIETVDFAWVKKRSGADDHRLANTVTGGNKHLKSNTTEAESTSTNIIQSFSGNTFTVGSDNAVNASGGTYVGWVWKESATPGFDIVTYTGDGSNTRTISHGLGVAPAFYITKNRDGYNAASGFNDWNVYHKSITGTNSTTGGPIQAFLMSTGAAASGVGGICAAPTSTVFSPAINAYDNVSSRTYIAYLWSEVAGFSKFGSYTGNGSSNGPFVFCGFRPRWIMIKRTDSANSWVMLDTARDTFNITEKNIYAESSGAEALYIAEKTDILSNGFKQRQTGVSMNANGGTYIFMAFAESPFKYALAR